MLAQRRTERKRFALECAYVKQQIAFPPRASSGDVKAFYTKHSPERVAQSHKFARHYKDKQAEFNQRLRATYGVVLPPQFVGFSRGAEVLNLDPFALPGLRMPLVSHRPEANGAHAAG